jgi:8-oxo-dGTP diphosphatase
VTGTSTEIIARAVIRRDGKVLLARHKAKSWSFLPGGHVEPGEPVETALVRELAEELGVDATVVRMARVVEHGYVEDDATHHELNLVFDVELAEFNVASQEAHLEFEWFALDQLADVDLRPSPLKDALTAPNNGARLWTAWTPTVE